MDSSSREDFDRYVVDFELDGLKGRYWQAPALKEEAASNTLVAVYGHHSSLERNRGLAQYLRRFGQVIIPDLPGFGGMDSFYSLRRKPTLDNYADYLKSFLDFKLKSGAPVVLVGFSFGFLVITRFLQKYPQYWPNLRSVVSVAGFARCDALKFKPLRRWTYISLGHLVKTRPGAAVLRHIFLSGPVLRRIYARTYMAKHKFADRSAEEKELFMNMEVNLWHLNDSRTWAYTAVDMLAIDQTAERVDLALCHLGVAGDQFLDATANKIALQKIYNKVMVFSIDSPTHAPSVIASPEEIADIMPTALADTLYRSFVA